MNPNRKSLHQVMRSYAKQGNTQFKFGIAGELVKGEFGYIGTTDEGQERFWIRDGAGETVTLFFDNPERS